MKTKLFAILLVGLLAVAVASAQDQQDGYPAADTPQQALLNLQQSLVEGDTEAFVNCFETTDDGRRLLGALFDVILAFRELGAAVVEAFGEEAAGAFAEMNSDPFGEIADASLDDLTLEVTGNTATCAAPDGDGEPLELIQVNGVWRIQVPDLPPTDEEFESALLMMEGMAGVVRGTIEKIDDPGMTVDQLKEDLGMRMMELMFSIMAEQEEQEAPAE